MWIIFEGLDKSGKGTLEWELLKATNFKHIVIDRGPAGYIAFDRIFDRVTKEKNNEFLRNIALMKAYPEDFLIVYCKAPINVAIQRLKEHNETCPYDYKLAQDLYDKCIEFMYKKHGIKVITVDTAKTVKECIDLIIGGLK